MSQLRFNKRADLIAALEARRSWAEKYDERAAKRHRRDEDAVLADIKKKCAQVGRMTLTQVKETLEAEGKRHPLRDLLRGDRAYDLPSCPTSAVTRLDETLEMLRITKQETFVLTGIYNRDPIDGAYWLLTHNDLPRKETVCQ